MSNEKRFVVKHGLQSQNMEFVSPDKAKRISVSMLDSGTISFSGDSGELFSVTDTMSGTIFAVNDISGIPSFEVEDTGTVRIAETVGNVLIGTATDNGSKLQVKGTVSANNVTITGALSANGTIGTTGQTLRSDGTKSFWSTEVGYTGSQGTTGFTGSFGATGFNGSVGFTGSQGTPGTSGGDGTNGVNGFTGSVGATGFTGSVGFAGSVGATGFTGSVGFVGSKGFDGSRGFNGSVGATGFNGSVGFTGSIGATGFNGSIGFNGSQGPAGNFGGATFDYTFDTTTTNADPGVGKLRLNNANVTLATQLYIDDQNDSSTDIQSFLRTIDDSTSTLKGHYRISNKLDASDFAIFTITSIVEETGHFTVNSAYVTGSATAFTNNEDVIITFARTGDIGATGFTGSFGATGFTGSIGFTGSFGNTGFVGSQGVAGPIAGTDGQIIYNNGGVSGGANVYYDDVNQRLGIGISTPSRTLDVSGQARISSVLTMGSYIQGTTQLDLYGDATSSLGVRLTSTGQLGIGTTSPSAKLDLVETWNNVATTFTHIKSNVTDTTSAAGSLLMDLQVGSLSKFRVGKDAQVSAGSFMIGFSPESTTSMSGLSRNGNNLLVTTVGTQAFNFGTGAFISARPIAIGPDAYTADVVLNRDAANILAQRNGINAQTLRVYNTYTDASNYERLAINNDGSSYFQLETQHAGTGTAKDIALRPNSTLKVQNASGGAQIYLQPGAGVGPIISSNSQLNLQSGTNSTIRFAQGSALTTNTTPFKFETTYNDAATTYRGIAFDLTDTASGSTSRLLDFKVGTEDIFSVRKDGGFGIDQFRILPSTSLYGRVLFSGAERVRIGSSFVELNSSGHFSWSSTGNPGSADTFIYRDAANTLAQRNGINAQTSRIYNTYTDASNYERAKIGWNGGILEIGTENAGTGTLRNISLIGGNVGIGTGAPAGKFHVTNTYTNTSDASIIAGGTIPGINLRSTGGARMSVFTNYATADSTSFLTSTGSANPSTEVLRFNHTNGNVLVPTTNLGIGTITPAAGLHSYFLNTSTTTVAVYGQLSSVTYPGNNDTKAGQFVNGNYGLIYGVYGETTNTGVGEAGSKYAGYFKSAGGIYTDSYGVYAESTQANTGGAGIAYGGYFKVAAAGSGSVGQTYGMRIENTATLGAASYGLVVSTVAGPTSIVPLRVVHAGTEIFRVGSNGDALVNGLTVGRGTAAIETNVAIGVRALNVNTTGADSAAVGYEALALNTTGTANTAVGRAALAANTGGSANTAIGRNALLANTTGATNTATGLGALGGNTTGSNNTCIGHQSGGSLTTGSNNTIIGRAPGTAGLADTVIISAGLTERLRINSSGNLGIATELPTQRLDVAGNTTLRNGTTATNLTVHNTYTDASNYEHAKLGWNANVLEIGTVAAGTGTLRNINLIGGNVGIGTSSPAFKLHLYEATANPQIRIQNGSTGAIDITPTSINSGQHLAISASSYLLLASTTNDIIHRAVMSHKFENNSANEWMRITATGNVGINTASPSAKLDVAGDIEVNSNVNLNSEATTLATTTKTQIASFPVASFRSGKLIVQAYDSVTGQVQISELLVAHNGTTASATEYGVVFTGTTSIVIYDVDISAGNVRLLATRTTANSTQYKISETLMIA